MKRYFVTKKKAGEWLVKDREKDHTVATSSTEEGAEILCDDLNREYEAGVKAGWDERRRT